MDVVLVSPGWPATSFANGIASYVGNVRAGLTGIGVDSWVLAHETGSGDIDPQVVDLMQFKPRASKKSIRDLVKRILPNIRAESWTFDVRRLYADSVIAGYSRVRESCKPDLIEMDDSFGAAGLVAAAVDVPVVVRLHGPYFLTAVAMGARRDDAYRHRVEMERESTLAAPGLTAPSADLLDQVRQEYQCSLPHAEVIPNPAPVVAPSDLWRAEAVDPNLVLFVGRFDRHKGGDLVIDAFARLASERPEIRLAFIGPDHNYSTDDGRPQDLPRFLDERAFDKSMLARFEYLGRMPAADITAYRKKAAVTVVASRWENFPMTVLEALAHGCPLVAADTGGVPEIVEDGDNGLLFPAGDVDAMAAAIARMLDDCELAANCGRAAAATIQTGFSIDVVARQTRDYYERVLTRVASSEHEQRRG